MNLLSDAKLCSKGNRVYDSIYVTFWTKRKYQNGKQNGRLPTKEPLEGILGGDELFCVVLE